MSVAQLTFEDAAQARDQAIARVSLNAGSDFLPRAKAFVLGYLERHGEASGEDIVNACKEAGIVPDSDDRAFGGAFLALSRRGVIEKCGACLRRRGHLTSGGNLWRLVDR